MKSVKLHTSNVHHNLLLDTKHKIPQGVLIKPLSKLEKIHDCQLFMKKNYFAFKIHFMKNETSKSFKNIIKRNYKYQKRLWSQISILKPGFDSVKLLKSLSAINMLNYFIPFNKNESLLPENQEKIMRLLFHRDSKLENVKVTYFVFKFLKKERPHQIRRIKKLGLNLNYNDKLMLMGPENEDLIEELQQNLADLNRFQNLISLALDLSSFPNFDQDFLYEMVKNLNTIETLSSLRLIFNFRKSDRQMPKIKQEMKKFSQLTSLALHLKLFQSLSPGTGFFVNLLALSNLTNLSLYLDCNQTFDCSDLAEAISSLKTLSSLKIYLKYLLFIGQDTILKGVQKCKKLKSFCLRQSLAGNHDTFGFGSVTKTIQMLKAVEKIRVDIGGFTQDRNEMIAFLKCLVNHPKLQEAKFCFNRNLYGLMDYEFDQDFYDDIRKLLSKLKVFHLELRKMSPEISQKIMKIFQDNRKDDINYTCKISGLFDVN